jgi:hypothetical protein
MASKTLDLIHRFDLQVDKICEHKDFFKSISFDLNIDARFGGKATKRVMNDKDLLPVLVAFRGIYMKNDLNFKNVIESIMREESLRSYWKSAEEWNIAWDRAWDPNHNTRLVIGVDHQNFDTKKIFDIWLNEGYMHPEKFRPGSGKGLDALKINAIIEGNSHFIWISFLQHVALLVVQFNYNVVKKILKEYGIKTNEEIYK